MKEIFFFVCTKGTYIPTVSAQSFLRINSGFSPGRESIGLTTDLCSGPARTESPSHVVE